MKFYEKKIPIYENCMISIFRQPGTLSKKYSKTANSAGRSVLRGLVEPKEERVFRRADG